jgi:hypothetical protein
VPHLVELSGELSAVLGAADERLDEITIAKITNLGRGYLGVDMWSSAGDSLHPISDWKDKRMKGSRKPCAQRQIVATVDPFTDRTFHPSGLVVLKG